MTRTRTTAKLLMATALAACLTAACGAPQGEAAWPPTAKKWFDRAQASYRVGDVDEAELAAENALRLLPQELEVKLLAAKIAIARLEYARVVELLRGAPGSEAQALRGRALWYDLKLEDAADELEALIADPEVHDAWAVEVAKLARRGSGRTPFAMSGGLLAVTEMPRVRGASMVVPVEVNGEPALALVATGSSEVVADASGSQGPKWISLRFGERVEVRDVPALTKDLSGISRELNAPIKLLLGSNLLRRMRTTIDFVGDQFVVRTFEPPPPPDATTVPVSYVRGGGMIVRPALGGDETSPRIAALIDSSLGFAVALDEEAWKLAGYQLSDLEPLPGNQNLRRGVLPLVSLGTLQLPQVPAFYGAPIPKVEESLGIDLGGLLGSEFLAVFRATFADQGRTLWLEDLPRELAPIPELLPPPTRSQPGSPAASGAPSQPPSPGAVPPGPADLPPSPTVGDVPPQPNPR